MYLLVSMYLNGAPGVRRTDYQLCKAFSSARPYYSGLSSSLQINNIYNLCVLLCVHKKGGADDHGPSMGIYDVVGDFEAV